MIERSAAQIALTIVKTFLIEMLMPPPAAAGRVIFWPTAILTEAGAVGASLVRSGRAHRVEELADLELEAVRVAGQRLRRGEHLR